MNYAIMMNIPALFRDLVFIWCKLYFRGANATEKHFLQECKLLLMSATNVKAIFPFMKVILTEVCLHTVLLIL